jgi:hypothetical protein
VLPAALLHSHNRTGQVQARGRCVGVRPDFTVYLYQSGSLATTLDEPIQPIDNVAADCLRPIRSFHTPVDLSATGAHQSYALLSDVLMILHNEFKRGQNRSSSEHCAAVALDDSGPIFRQRKSTIPTACVHVLVCTCLLACPLHTRPILMGACKHVSPPCGHLRRWHQQRTESTPPSSPTR